MDTLPFRQVHLDFHTSGLIDGIGTGFDKEEFQKALTAGCIDSITVFSKCHHGYSYHPSQVNEMHPHLKFDLLAAQLEACREIGVRAPVYISAGYDEKDALQHPEWLLKFNPDMHHDFLFHPGWHFMCLGGGYLDKLIAEIEEVMERYDPVEIFLDICDVRPCYCNHCIQTMQKRGLDPFNYDDVLKMAEITYANYAKRVEEAIHKHNPNTHIFHNAGNIPMGRRDLAGYDSHLELESLPTGGWGYDHFPMSAAYCRNLGKEYLGMTGKFHGAWGEFGGFKHPNALIYETSLSLAMGAKCSIGDQLHPTAKINEATYRLIGQAYKLVKEKEPWCRDVKAIADIGVLSASSENNHTHNDSDVGANRILLEGKYLYDFIDADSDFSQYKLIILPDQIPARPELTGKLKDYLQNGGKILASGSSCMAEKGRFLDDTSVRDLGNSQYQPTYFRPSGETGFVNGISEYVMYSENRCFQADSSFQTVGYAVEPYFNRKPLRFCSHQHTPDAPGRERPGAVVSENIGYIGWNVFAEYAQVGSLHLKELVTLMVEKLLGSEKTLRITGLPDRGVATLLEQTGKNRMLLHCLYAHTTVRGKNTEIIEDCVPLHNIAAKLQLDRSPVSVQLVPQNQAIDYTYKSNELVFTIPTVNIHQMVEIKF